MASFALEIVTPYGRFHGARARSAVFATEDGELEVLAGHQPLVVPVEPCVLRVSGDSGDWSAAIGEGFARIKPEATTIMVDSAEMSSDVDVERARAALQRAQERLSPASPPWIRAQSRKAVARAVARIKAAG
ncbi:MAG: ATP synthase F1 subunit epsilon, partial [Spirochaetes bacterium]|nr:ATP synthase F1 subunit epsilon [Spirochaetota bacterium]